MKKPIVFTLIILLSTQIINSQNKKIVDSLQILLANHPTEDSIRVDILTRLHEKLMFAKPMVAKKYAEEELRISQKIGYQSGIGKGLMHLADYYTNRSNTDSALYYYKRAKKVFALINKVRGIVFVNYSIADIERTSGNFQTAITILKENLKLIEENETHPKAISKFSAGMYHSLGSVYMEKGDYKIAVIETLKALDLFTEIKDEARRADALKQLGNLEYKLANYQKAIKYYNEAMKTYADLNDDFYLAYAKNSAGLAYKELGRLAEAKENQQAAIALARKNQVQSVLSASLNNLSQLYMLEKNYKVAKELLMEAKEIAEKEDLKLPLASAYKSLAEISFKNNKHSEALFDINKAIDIEKNVGAMPDLQSSHLFRAKIFEQLGKTKNAINDLKIGQKINDSLFNIKQVQQIEELKTIYETEKKEAEIALQDEEIKTLNEKAKVDRLTKGLYAGGMASALALFVLSVFGYRQRIKKNRIAREKQEEIYKQEIEHKQKELASQTLHLVQKNTFIQELKENLENIKKSPEKFKTEFRRIVMLLKKENASDKDWEVFKTYFADVHNDFDQKLKTLAADISEKEIRLAAFLRMNLTTKEIAATLNVLPDSILKSKYRLKKKLNINKETDLTSFLNRL